MEGAIAAAFTAGLLGGVHCVGMCGGIVGALSASARGPSLARQLAFNAGRIGSYATAGAIAGMVGAAFTTLAVTDARLVLLAMANVFMAMVGLYVAGWGGGVVRLEALGKGAWNAIAPLRRRIVPIDTTPRALAAGAVWGWVPCGLVYGLLVLAVASGTALQGALVMAAFGMGTLPALLVSGVAATKVLAWRKAPLVRRTAGALLVGMAVVGFARIPALHEALVQGWNCIQ